MSSDSVEWELIQRAKRECWHVSVVEVHRLVGFEGVEGLTPELVTRWGFFGPAVRVPDGLSLGWSLAAMLADCSRLPRSAVAVRRKRSALWVLRTVEKRLAAVRVASLWVKVLSVGLSKYATAYPVLVDCPAHYRDDVAGLDAQYRVPALELANCMRLRGVDDSGVQSDIDSWSASVMYLSPIEVLRAAAEFAVFRQKIGRSIVAADLVAVGCVADDFSVLASFGIDLSSCGLSPDRVFAAAGRLSSADVIEVREYAAMLYRVLIRAAVL